MKKLDESKLQIGDIVLTTSNHIFSKIIKAATRSDISHAMIYVQSHSVIDSTGEGVQARNTQRLFYEDNCPIFVLRLRTPLLPEKLRLVIDFARSKCATEYSSLEAIFIGILSILRVLTRKQFCSRLVAQSYARANISLADNENFCSPNDIKKSPLLFFVKNPERAVSADEIRAIQTLFDTQRVMIEVTNTLLNGARTKSRSIQCINDLDLFLIEHPEFDDFFENLYEESGYLGVMALEKSKNAWQYDIVALNVHQMPEMEKRRYCEMALVDQDEGMRRFQTNLGVYSKYSINYELKTFMLLKDFYGRMVKDLKDRKNVAEQWLSSHN